MALRPYICQGLDASKVLRRQMIFITANSADYRKNAYLCICTILFAMRKIFLLLFALILPCIYASAQDYIESYSHNSGFREAERTLQYRPTEDGFIESAEGDNLYTRALYGSHSLWRLETSDRPIFAAYHKRDNRNIRFAVETKGVCVRLDSTASCRALYRGGARIYTLYDPRWGKGKITVTALADRRNEAAHWKIAAEGMPSDTKLVATCAPTVKVKLSRSGDMGADPANCFAPDLASEDQKSCALKAPGSTTVYVTYADRDVRPGAKADFDRAEADRQDIIGRVTISVPDPYLNTIASSLMEASDGIWDGKTYQHGAVGWRMPLSGWRGAYTGDFLGWHDRARTHFDAYAASQVTEVAPTIPHPSQDPQKNHARALKEWGTQMYSDGYICRNPERNDQMHHYDMNLCYIDELLWHLQWTGDMDYARKIWPVIEKSLAWEKRNYDPDDDGLYDAYCCIWASDALYYNSAAVTHSTAYNYRANALAADIAERIGVDPTPYRKEAEKILAAMNATLWIPEKGVWAEHVDKMGKGLTHSHPGLWTVYHAVDSDTSTPEQAYRATRYIDSNIPHIPVRADGLDGEYATISTTDWMPYAWSINNVAFAEVYHTALAYWLAGRPDEATHLLKSAVLDGMYIGSSPGNIGQVSHYDAARGECYRDFADPVGVLSRALVQGLFGFTPEAIHRRVTVRPGFPGNWQHASISHPDFSITYSRGHDRLPDIYGQGATERSFDKYDVDLRMQSACGIDSLRFILPLRSQKPLTIVDGNPVQYKIQDGGTPYATICLSVPASAASHTSLIVVEGDDDFAPVDVAAPRYADIPAVLGVKAIPGAYSPVDMTAAFNADVTDIFNQSYLSPRSPYTTLQIPSHGMGEWCHPNDTANIDDSYLRRCGGILSLPDGTTFTTPSAGHNAAYVSLFDNYPDSVSVALQGKADGIALLMAGSTNHMQAYVENANVCAVYADGSEEKLSLVAPYNWCPIEQDYFIDGKAFSLPTPRPTRLTLKEGVASANLGDALGIDGVYGRRIDGGAATVLYLPLNPEKQLSSLRLIPTANEVVVGLLAASYINHKEI